MHGEHLNLALLASSLLGLGCQSFVLLILLRDLRRLFDDLFGINHLRLNDVVVGVVVSQTVSQTAEAEIQG